MSRTIGSTLPRTLRDAFDGSVDPRRVGLGYPLATVDEDGRPRPAMLSAGEILAMGDEVLRLAMWPDSTSAANLAAGRPCFVTYVGPGVVYHVHGRATALVSEPAAGRGPACFELQVERVDADAHPGLPTVQTITYACEAISVETVLEDWRDSLDRLRRATRVTGDHGEDDA